MVKNIAVCVVIDSTRFAQTYRWTTIKAATIRDRVTKEAFFSQIRNPHSERLSIT